MMAMTMRMPRMFLFYFGISHFYKKFFSLFVGMLRLRSAPHRDTKKLAVVVDVLQTTQNLVISCCCFATEGKEMYQEL